MDKLEPETDISDMVLFLDVANSEDVLFPVGVAPLLGLALLGYCIDCIDCIDV